MATGNEDYNPPADISVYNPVGPSVQFQRAFHSGLVINTTDNSPLSMVETFSPGLSSGWVHNYDVTLMAAVPNSWCVLYLVYPNGAYEAITPVVNATTGVPTGTFTTNSGSPYFVRGVPGPIVGDWRSITVTWKDQTGWRFTSHDNSLFELTRITNNLGLGIDLHWAAGHLLTSVSNDRNVTLLSCAYDANGNLTSICDAYGRQVTYTFTRPAGFVLQ